MKIVDTRHLNLSSNISPTMSTLPASDGPLLSSTQFRLKGLIAAPFTPLLPGGEIDFEKIGPYARFLEKRGVSGVFVCGTTGEGGSLTIAERKAVLENWQMAAGDLTVIAHVGHASVAEARNLAIHAGEVGVDAIAAMPSSRHLPDGPQELVDWCAAICDGAPSLPFYYYHIPSVSGVTLPVRRMIDLAVGQIPTFAGVKFTHEDMLDFQICTHYAGGVLDVSFGRDEMLLAALVMGAQSAVGSTYNFLSPLFADLIARFRAGDLEGARQRQLMAAEALAVIIDAGGLSAIKAAMGLFGFDVGGTRLPMRTLTGSETRDLGRALDGMGFLQTMDELTDPAGLVEGGKAVAAGLCDEVLA
jgi:N-acetylneuraminate lyase